MKELVRVIVSSAIITIDESARLFYRKRFSFNYESKNFESLKCLDCGEKFLANHDSLEELRFEWLWLADLGLGEKQKKLIEKGMR
jgi:hypothetical protein